MRHKKCSYICGAIEGEARIITKGKRYLLGYRIPHMK
jgi:hypothetical protein